MHGVVNGVFYCQEDRTQQLSDRMYSRNTSNAPIKMYYSIRPTQTRYVHLPIVDQRLPPTVQCQQKPIYNTQTMFAPTTSLPFNGYQANIDTETRLRNTIFPLQSCPQAYYMPGTQSDMYDASYLTQGKHVNMTNPLLFHQEKFNAFDPNTCNIGHDQFYNHTRVQTKGL